MSLWWLAGYIEVHHPTEKPAGLLWFERSVWNKRTSDGDYFGYVNASKRLSRLRFMARGYILKKRGIFITVDKAKNRFKHVAGVCTLLLVSGCSDTGKDQFTLKTEMPADFKLQADAHYVPATGEVCTARRRKNGRLIDKKRFISEVQDSQYTAVFNIPLAIVENNCPLVLDGLKLDVEGRWGPGRWDLDGDIAGISFRDGAPVDNVKSGSIENTLYNGECQWFFRTAGPERYIIKVLRCRAIDSNGEVLKHSAGGILRRDTLGGKTISMGFKVADSEKPYFKKYWFKTVAGWKPCDGHWGRATEELCLSPPQFKNFKMPDGRDCSVYPNCTE
ncbi:hypothetical protein QN391_25390 [Pseudomonas sp. CCI1.2]|uniref:hypothetical protein n=1 Tax=Pseudomonas sp. CCI1.2 TaxID=3048614 RepID=UPI002B230A00|nr:hypothetical protein [Pseudomonas sp. CCI1.2]MEB0123988.1 hypothetical protein [Pseudomonas sp. CCI1.2]